VIAYDTNKELFERLGSDKVTMYEYTWCDDFSHKRNFLAEKIKSEYYLRMDTDDELGSPENIRKTFDSMVIDGTDVVYCPYLYAFDPDGNCIARHWRETIIKKKKSIYWKKSIHENIFIEDLDDYKGSKDDSISIIHHTDDEHARKSQDRNFKILVEEFERDKEDTDPRTIGYIGRVLLGEGLYDRAIPFLELFLKKSGWPEDKYFGFVQLAEANIYKKDYDTAISCCFESMGINEYFPDAYLMLGHVYLEKGEYKKALNWLHIGKSKPAPDTLSVVNPAMYGFMADMNIAMCYLGLGKYEEGYKHFKRAKSEAPKNRMVKNREPMFVEAIENNNYLKNMLWNLKYCERHDPSKCQEIVKTFPNNLLKVDVTHQMINKYSPKVVHSDKSVVFYCGTAWEEWAPPSVSRGIGGSEEAVIYLSQELVKCGWDVTVYNNCGDFRGTYSGVKYRNYFEFNSKDDFNVLIGWRGNIFGPYISAKRRIIWLHDVPQEGQFTPSNIDHVDKILVLSQYHKTLLPDCVPEDKIFVSANGINIKDFDLKVVPDRNPKRIIYTSSYDRGIEHLLNMWSDVRKEVPDAELHLFYGWNTYDSMVEKGVRSKEFKNKMVKLMEKDGVFEHGRVGHKDLIKEFYSSGIWAYPSHFEEISCISAMKAQACGCVPVYVNYAALKETVKDGIAIDGKAGVGLTNFMFKEELINLLNKPELQSVYRGRILDYKDSFGWGKVADQWSKELFVEEGVLV